MTKKNALYTLGILAIAIAVSALILETPGIIGTSQALECPTGWNC